MKNFDWKLPLIIGVAIVGIVLMMMFIPQSSQNKAIALEEAVYTAESDVETQEMARISKVQNLADCVMQYDKHEAETLMKLAESMSKGNEVENVSTSIAAITYAYPELKSDQNYKTLMNELIVIENTIAKYRENYNGAVGRYNSYVKKFPTRNFLSFTGYEVKHLTRLEFNTPAEAPTNLFGN